MVINWFIYCFLIAGSYSQEWKRWEPGNWERCQDGSALFYQQAASETVVDTREYVKDLRSKFTDHGIAAYIVPSGDFHLSEFVSAYDSRRAFISGFSGSSGSAVITKDAAALWTDGRYFLQAEGQLHCSWFLMREGEDGVPSITEWLVEVLSSASSKRVGASPYFFGNDEWNKYETELEAGGIKFEPIIPDLIDVIWTINRPAFPSSTINSLPIEYAGKSWQSKIEEIQAEMGKRNTDVLVITGLDETAWLFNMRGKDITGFVNDPFFYSLAIIQRGTNITKLYLKDHKKKLTLTPDDPVTKVPLYEHLNTPSNGLCDDESRPCVQVKEYEYTVFMYDLQSLAQSADVKKVWVSYHCNYAIFRAIPTNKVLVDNTPAAMMKAMKNDIEVDGMKKAHIRDAAALIRFLAELEDKVTAGETWTEMSGKDELSRYRSMQELARGDSFSAISSVGPNAAINHYFVNNVTDRNITTHETYLLDSGGQYVQISNMITIEMSFDKEGKGAKIRKRYNQAQLTQDTNGKVTTLQLDITNESQEVSPFPAGVHKASIKRDGTTDVTRTLLYRFPTDFEKECYTRVLMGQINLAQAIWSKGLFGRDIDAFARKPLWDVGLVYRHGTGHGIGAYLSVHEGPGRISNHHARFPWDVPLDKHMFFSDEPGYYQAGEFGIRLENIIFVKEVETKYKFEGATMLGFETITLVPYEPHMIDYSLLTEKQVKWLNHYNQECYKKVGPLLRDQEDERAMKWLERRTQQIRTSGVSPLSLHLSLIFIGFVLYSIC